MQGIYRYFYEIKSKQTLVIYEKNVDLPYPLVTIKVINVQIILNIFMNIMSNFVIS